MKYKLVKKYPGSPELGYETKFNNSGEDWSALLKVADCKYFPEFWEEVKDPLFITEDGKEIYEGDNLYFLNKISGTSGEYYWGGTYQFDHKKYFQGNPDKDKFYWFASKQKLELFWKELEQNKPIYSKKQIEEALLSSKEGNPIAIIDEGFVIISEFNEKKFKQKLGI